MPIYVYECPKHGQFEKIMPMSEAGKPHPCPKKHCMEVAESVDAVPARRNPDYGIQR